MLDDKGTDPAYRVLHAIVGHKLPVYFANAVNSVLSMAVDDDVLVVDNASDLPALTQELQSTAAREPRVHLLLRESNDTTRNRKVGGLYDAYNQVMEHALRGGYDYLHIMQHDMQLLWWDETVPQRASEIFAEYPECVNIPTQALPRHAGLSDGLEYVKPKLLLLQNYGLTDTGLYDLAKWRARDIRFCDSEGAHALKYWREGLRVFCHPLPTVAPIPWPAVVRAGKVIGREVQPREKYLLRPLTGAEINQVKESTETIWLESVCVPWGWTCLTPYWVTDLRAINSVNYWVFRYRDIRRRGLGASWPRWERRGLPAGASVRGVQRLPRFGRPQLVIQSAWQAARQAIGRSGR
jgi:hypothetical protein